MKILAINASYRGKNGYTQFLINKVFEGAKTTGAECETIVLSEHDVKRCICCFTLFLQLLYMFLLCLVYYTLFNSF